MDRVTAPPLLASLTFLSLNSCHLGSSEPASRVVALKGYRSVQQQGASSAACSAQGAALQAYPSAGSTASFGTLHGHEQQDDSPDCHDVSGQAWPSEVSIMAQAPDRLGNVDVIQRPRWLVSGHEPVASLQYAASNSGSSRPSWWQADAEVGQSLSEDQLAWQLHASDSQCDQQTQPHVTSCSGTEATAWNVETLHDCYSICHQAGCWSPADYTGYSSLTATAACRLRGVGLAWLHWPAAPEPGRLQVLHHLLGLG